MNVPHSFGLDSSITSCSKYRRDDKLPQGYLTTPGVKDDLCLTCFHARHEVDADGVTVVPCERAKRKATNHGKSA